MLSQNLFLNVNMSTDENPVCTSCFVLVVFCNGEHCLHTRVLGAFVMLPRVRAHTIFFYLCVSMISFALVLG